MDKFIAGERVKIIRAVTCSAEPYLGKVGTIIRPGKGYKEAQYFVQVDGVEKQQTFYGQELQKLT